MRCPNCLKVCSEQATACAACGVSFDALPTPLENVEPTDDTALDPEQAVGTVVGVFDREKDVGTRIGAAPLRRRRSAPAFEAADSGFSGGFLQLPESAVSHGLDRSVADLRIFVARMGVVGRLTLYAMSLVVVCGFLPWHHKTGVGYSAGLEDQAWLPMGLTGLGALLHALRYRRGALLRPLTALGAVVLAAAAVLSMGYIFRVNEAIEPMLRPELVVWGGFWPAALAAVLALLGTIVALKDIGTRP